MIRWADTIVESSRPSLTIGNLAHGLSDNAMSKTVEQIIEVVVAPDGMQAFLRPVDENCVDRVDARTILTELRAKNIVINEEVTIRLQQFLAEARENVQIRTPFLVAEGRQPVSGRPARFTRCVDALAGCETSFDRTATQFLHFVRPGDLIGRLHPSTRGTSGEDVRGRPVAPSKVVEEPIAIGMGLQLSDDGRTVFAEGHGRVIDEGGRISLRSVVEVDSEAATEARSTSDLMVRRTSGEVGDLFCNRSIIIVGNLAPARVHANEDIFVSDGICGHYRGSVAASRDIVTLWAKAADIHAGRDVIVGSQLIDCHVFAGRALDARSSRIVGGYTEARTWIHARTLGSKTGEPTRLTFGATEQTMYEARRLEDEVTSWREEVFVLTRAVDALKLGAKYMGMPQRNRAERLNEDLQAQRYRMRAAEDRRAMMLADSGIPAGVRVCDVIFPGVRVTASDLVYCFEKMVAGPVRIELRGTGGATALVAIDERTGVVTRLSSRKDPR